MVVCALGGAAPTGVYLYYDDSSEPLLQGSLMLLRLNFHYILRDEDSIKI